MRFSWKTIYRSFWGRRGSRHQAPINCQQCGTEQRITRFGRYVFLLLGFTPMYIFMTFISPINNFFLNSIAGICIYLIGSLIAPYFVKFRTVTTEK